MTQREAYVFGWVFGRLNAESKKNGSEECQPLEIQVSWQLGYYAGKSKRPLAREAFDFDIVAARKAKGMTQAQLADAMGVDQPVISRWESGKVSPNKENLAKLKEILQD